MGVARGATASLASCVAVEEEAPEHPLHDKVVAAGGDALAVVWCRAQAPRQMGIINNRNQVRRDVLAFEVHQEGLAAVECLAAGGAGDHTEEALSELVLPHDRHLAGGDFARAEPS